MIVARLASKIAVVEMHGAIGGRVRSADVERLIERVLADPRMRAVALDKIGRAHV